MERPRGRRRRALADATTTTAPLPVCDKSETTWPAGASQACTAHVLVSITYGIEYSVSDLMRMCESSACLSLAAFMRAANPAECVAGYKLTLYDGFLNRLDAACAEMHAPHSKDDEEEGDGNNNPTLSPSPIGTKTKKPSPTSAKRTPGPKKAGNDSSSAVAEEEDLSGSLDASGASSKASSERLNSTAVTRSPGSQSSSGSSFLPGSVSPSSSSAGASSPQTSKRKANSPSTEATDAAQGASVSSSSSTGVTVAAIVGVLVLVALAALFVLRRRRRAATQHDKSTPTIETGRYRQDEATFATLDSSDHDTYDSTGNDAPPNPSRLARADLAPLLEPLVAWQIDSSELTDVALIGSGAQGAVYLVQLNATRLLVAKRLVPDQLTERKLKSLVAEVQLVATLQHPSIVGFVGVAWSSPFNLQALFEYMPNGDLRSFLDGDQHGVGSWNNTKLEIALAIAEGLAYVHSFNPPIVHRDLKTRNVLLDDSFAAKISDFGVSRLQSEDGTMTTGIGTSRWLAPEVIAGGGTYTEQCDIYSFGVVLVEMDTHALPFAATDSCVSEIMLLRQVSRGELRPAVSSTCEPRVAALVDWCLHQNPNERPNALELSFELRQFLKPRENP